jgi:hypothetical protein
VSWQASEWAVKQRAGSATAKATLMVLAEAANARGECFPSQPTIAKRAELSERCVWQALADLQGGGLIIRQARRNKRGHRTSDLITLQLTQPATPAVRPDPPQPAAAATRTDESLTANGAPPTRTSCNSLPAPGAAEPVRDEEVREEARYRRASLSRVPTNKPTRDELQAFDTFWAAYPIKIGRKPALTKFVRVLRTGAATPEQLRDGATTYARERAGEDPSKTKHAEGWLRDERWLDEAASARLPGRHPNDVDWKD